MKITVKPESRAVQFRDIPVMSCFYTESNNLFLKINDNRCGVNSVLLVQGSFANGVPGIVLMIDSHANCFPAKSELIVHAPR